MTTVNIVGLRGYLVPRNKIRLMRSRSWRIGDRHATLGSAAFGVSYATTLRFITMRCFPIRADASPQGRTLITRTCSREYRAGAHALFPTRRPQHVDVAAALRLSRLFARR